MQPRARQATADRSHCAARAADQHVLHLPSCKVAPKPSADSGCGHIMGNTERYPACCQVMRRTACPFHQVSPQNGVTAAALPACPWIPPLRHPMLVPNGPAGAFSICFLIHLRASQAHSSKVISSAQWTQVQLAVTQALPSGALKAGSLSLKIHTERPRPSSGRTRIRMEAPGQLGGTFHDHGGRSTPVPGPVSLVLTRLPALPFAVCLVLSQGYLFNL